MKNLKMKLFLRVSTVKSEKKEEKLSIILYLILINN